jgi:hypothetical protein
MAKIVGRHHHHKHYRVRRAIQEHTDGGRPIMGLQLPQRFMTPVPYSYTVFPKGWVFKKSPPPGTGGMVLGGLFFLLIVACIALVKLFGG